MLGLPPAKFHFSGIRVRLKSLKFALLFVTGCIASILIIELTIDGLEAWKKYQHTKTLMAADAAGNRLVTAVYYLRREQPSVNAGFKGDTAAATDLRGRIAHHRKAAEEDLSASLPHLLALDFPNKKDIAEALRNAHAQANSARKRADAMIALPKAQRDHETQRDYNSAMTALIKAAENLWSAEGYVASMSDPQLARYSRIKRLSWKLRETAGLERSVIASTIVTGTKIPPQDLRQIENGRAQINFGWQLIQELIRHESGAAAIRAAVAGAKRNYFDTFRPLVDQMRKLNDQGAAYNVSLANWIVQTDPHIDSFLGVLRAAAKMGEKRAAELEMDAFSDLTLKIFGILVAFGASALCFLVVVSRVTNPLARIGRAVRDLAAGKLDVEVTDAQRDDEIGEMARAVDFFKANLIETKRMTEAQESERAEKERRAALIEASTKTFESKVAGVVRSLEASSTELETTSRSLSESAVQTDHQSSDVAFTAHETSINVQAVATATEELARSAREIGQQVTSSAYITGTAVDHVRHATVTIQELASSADQIGAVVKLISEIAEQTNLLALNATIEAARAGEAGRGFSIVASEVKALAEQTAIATNQINARIQKIQGTTRESVAAIQNIDTIIQQVNNIAVVVADALEQQQAATQDIAQNISDTAAGTKNVTRHISKVQQVAMQTGNAAKQLLGSASEVARSSSSLRSEVETFLTAVRKAS
jgi:methyl-accepting chemotaxis protein